MAPTRRRFAGAGTIPIARHNVLRNRMKLQPQTERPHGFSDMDDDALFTQETGVAP
ncbi:uncharacterized protein Dvar_57440 [Desulfosarcina variabilis str. Montpellier]